MDERVNGHELTGEVRATARDLADVRQDLSELRRGLGSLARDTRETRAALARLEAGLSRLHASAGEGLGDLWARVADLRRRLDALTGQGMGS